MPVTLANVDYSDTQSLDLYLVDAPRRPLVVCLHGGGFNSGSRDDERCRQAAALLVEAGFNCASIGYSLASRENRFSMWPRNLFDVADALTWLHDRAGVYGYDFRHFGMLGFSAGCCLCNLYIQGGSRIFRHFGYETPVFSPGAMVGFYGPYDFPSRQRERRSDSAETNRFHSPAYWLRHNTGSNPPPLLHIHGDDDKVVFPDQHEAFQNDCDARGYDFTAVIVEGFGHSFAPRDTNGKGKSIDLGPLISDFFRRHLVNRSG